jgi:hypothetical protein
LNRPDALTLFLVFVPKNDEVTREWRYIMDKLYSSPSSFGVVKLSRNGLDMQLISGK